MCGFPSLILLNLARECLARGGRLSHTLQTPRPVGRIVLIYMNGDYAITQFHLGIRRQPLE